MLFPNPRTETVDLYIIRQPKKSETINPIDHAKKGVDLVLSRIADPMDHDWTGHSSTLIMSGIPQKKHLDLIIKKPKDIDLIIKKPKDDGLFALDKNPIPSLTD